MTRHHKELAWNDEGAHGLGEIARRHAQADYREQFGTGGRTQNPPADMGTTGNPEPFDRGYGAEYEHDGGSHGRGESILAHGHRGRGPKNYARPDERIRDDICERLWDADDVDASDVTVEVKDAIVTLAGNVEQRPMKHRIEDIADACAGVKDVLNGIRVRPRNE